MDDSRGICRPASKRLRSTENDGCWMGSVDCRSGSSLAAGCRRPSTLANCVRCSLSNSWNRRRSLQLQKRSSGPCEDLDVIAVLDVKARYVRSLFSKVPFEYDILLGLLSFAQDRKWRNYVVSHARPSVNEPVLDVATGTGLLAADFALAIPRGGYVVGVDLTLSMLKTARSRLQARGIEHRVDWILARAENLPFREESFGSSSISLALRNVSDALMTFQEMSRATRQGGVVVSLDFARPHNRVFQIFYYDYLLGLFPLFGRLVSAAWGRTLSYLGRSILKARTGNQIANLLSESGLVDTRSVPLTAGIVCVVYGKKGTQTDQFA